jgi:hypothetical protein
MAVNARRLRGDHGQSRIWSAMTIQPDPIAPQASRRDPPKNLTIVHPKERAKRRESQSL